MNKGVRAHTHMNERERKRDPTWTQDTLQCNLINVYSEMYSIKFNRAYSQESVYRVKLNLKNYLIV